MHPETKCIIMTAYASLESTIEAIRLNAFDYLLKPFDLIKIAEIVDAAGEHASILRENRDVIDRLESANRRLEQSRSELNTRVLRANEELSEANESLKKHVTRLKMLYQMGRDISSNENWGDALDRFLMALCKYIDAEGTAIFLFSDGGRSLKVRTSYNVGNDELEGAVSLLSSAMEKDLAQPEIFSLAGCADGPPKTCLGMKEPWNDSVVPLIYKGKWLGFLFIRKEYKSRRSYLYDYHFINTIQTILSEEVANAVNISRLRNLKDFNETILENINSGVIKTDKTGRVVFRNNRAREIIGEENAGDLHFNELFGNPFGGEGLFEHLVRGECRNSTLEGTLAIPGGRVVPVRVNSTRVISEDFHGTSLVAVFEDLTAQKAMEEELRRADRLRSLGELSAGVAHEIRNPLTGIATTAQVLKEQLAGEPEKTRYLTVILDEIKRLDDIIRNLLNFARPARPAPREVTLNALVTETLDLLRDKAAESEVSIKFENRVADDACFIDGDQIKQVVLNIALNGIQASRAGGEMRICTANSTDPAFVRIEFIDSGKGIPDEIAEKLYNPFFTTKTEGTGLGLAITRKIVDSHGGKIFHVNEEGRGARFVVEMPRRMAADARAVETQKVY
jgi:PAS domain S-box-containing protein